MTRVITDKYITGDKLPAIQDLYTRQCQRKALKIVKDPSHPSHRMFSLLPHGKWYRSAKSRTKRLLNSFYPKAIRLLKEITHRTSCMAGGIVMLEGHVRMSLQEGYHKGGCLPCNAQC